jgi:hypothetical protein
MEEGVSDYDYLYESYRCVKCGDVVAYTNETCQLLCEEALVYERSKRFLRPQEEEALCQEIKESVCGSEFAFRQYLHDRCFASLDETSREQLNLLNRQNMVLPNQRDHCIFLIYYSTVHECSHFCEYCGNIIDLAHTGFAYCSKEDSNKNCHYLHHDCLCRLQDLRRVRREEQAIARSNFVRHLNDGVLSKEINALASRNNAWVRFMTDYELEPMEIDNFIEWIQYLNQERNNWNETQSQEWFTRVTLDLSDELRVVQNLNPSERQEISAPSTTQDLFCTPPDPQCIQQIPRQWVPLRLYSNLLSVVQSVEKPSVSLYILSRQ